MKQYYIYIMTNYSKTFYIGVTGNFKERIWQHKNKLVEGFIKKYNIDKLVYYELTGDIRIAIEREKQLKGWKRERKIKLIEKQNPLWIDLSNNLV